MTSGNVGNVFSIDPELGIIRVARELNLDASSEYILLVKATDYSPPMLHLEPCATCSLQYYITDGNVDQAFFVNPSR
ncbi:hypothetical protein TKK_0017850 [Trichogramma kaykai]